MVERELVDRTITFGIPVGWSNGNGIAQRRSHNEEVVRRAIEVKREEIGRGLVMTSLVMTSPEMTDLAIALVQGNAVTEIENGSAAVGMRKIAIDQNAVEMMKRRKNLLKRRRIGEIGIATAGGIAMEHAIDEIAIAERIVRSAVRIVTSPALRKDLLLLQRRIIQLILMERLSKKKWQNRMERLPTKPDGIGGDICVVINLVLMG